MSAELLAHVFEPFFQAPQQLARRTGGLGQGSRFDVVLPLGRQTATGAGAGDEQDAPAATPALRVLLVDDNEDAAITSAALLEGIGHEVRVAHSAAEALALGRQYTHDVAILDIGLPDMDGYALAAALRRDAAPMRLVALTGYGQKSDKDRAVQAGFDVHLTKPASAEDLRRATMPAALVPD